MLSTLDHNATARRFIQQADEEFARGDMLQASEKGWGAAAHAMKAIADTRGWPHSSHRDLFEVSRLAAEERGILEIISLFQIASATHRNFYEGWLSNEIIAINISAIRRLLEILEVLPDNGHQAQS